MLKKIFVFFFVALCCNMGSAAEKSFQIDAYADNGYGIKAHFIENNKTLMVVYGSPDQMGIAHGQLMGPQISKMQNVISTVGLSYTLKKSTWFYDKIRDVEKRTNPYMPERFLIECDGMSAAAGLPEEAGRRLNFFPEMFHCSGVAVSGSASKNGEVIHARVLDYMRDMKIYKYAAVQVFMPDDYYNWVSIGYAGFIGSVTAMNEKGLAIGEMGGGGEGRWDGIPMSMLIRRMMEECKNVDEAVALMKSVPLTCEYYYVFSDASGKKVAVAAKGGKDGYLRFYKDGEDAEGIPPTPKDMVYVSGGNRARVLQERLVKYSGQITPELMIEIIKPPVTPRSNLHNAIFMPQSLTVLFADASKKKCASEMPYTRFNLNELMKSLPQRTPAGFARPGVQ